MERRRGGCLQLAAVEAGRRALVVATASVFCFVVVVGTAQAGSVVASAAVV